MSTQVRFVPMWWRGQSASATAGSSTSARILSRVNSCASALPASLVKKSLNAYESALMPPRSQPAWYSRRRSVPRRRTWRAAAARSARPVRVARQLAALVEVTEEIATRVRIDRAVAGGHAVVRCPLEDEQPARLLGEARDRLDAGGAGADDPDPSTGRDRRRPAASAPVCSHSPRIGPGPGSRRSDRRQASDRHHAEARAEAGPVLGRDDPPVRCRVVLRTRDEGLEHDVAPQVEAIGDVVEVTQDLRLGRVALGPAPLAYQFVGERVGSSRCSRCRTARPDSGSRTTFRRRRRRVPEPWS